jgi:multiple sugar transport system permease protein
MIPGDIMLIPRYIIFKQLHILDTMWSLVLPATFDIYFVFMMRQAFIGIPGEISEAAKIDGCNHFAIYSRIILPLAKPSIVTMILFTFVWSWNDYMGPYIFISSLGKQMLSVGIKLFTEGTVTDPALQMSAATIVLMPVLALFLFSQKYFVEGVSSSAVKG